MRPTIAPPLSERIDLMMRHYFYRHQKRKRLLFRPSPDKGRTGGVCGGEIRHFA
jgi:hypothetical protein